MQRGARDEPHRRERTETVPSSGTGQRGPDARPGDRERGSVERVSGAVGEGDDRERVVRDGDHRVGAVQTSHHEAGDPDGCDRHQGAGHVVHTAHEPERGRVEEQDVSERQRQLPAEREPRELDVAAVPAGDDGKRSRAHCPARGHDGTVGHRAERDVCEHGAGAERDERNLVADARRVQRADASDQVRDGDGGDPPLSEVAVPLETEAVVAARGGHEAAAENQQRGRRAQPLALHAQLVAERRAGVHERVGGQRHRQRERARLVGDPFEQLRHGDHKTADRQPVPAPHGENADGACERDQDEAGHVVRRSRVDEQRRHQSAADRQRRDHPAVPAHREDRAHEPDERRLEQRQRGRIEVVQLYSAGEREEQSGEPGPGDEK